MRFPQLAAIIGCTTAALISIAPIRAEAATFQVKSGVTSIDRDHDEILKSIGLTITSQDQTIAPIPSNYLVGFKISPATNLRFSDNGGSLTPLSGTIEHTGTVTFNDTTTVGNFSIGLAPERIGGESGFILRETFSPAQLILFDLSDAGTPTFDRKNLTLTVPEIKLLFSPEFAQFIGNPSVAGKFAGTAQINAKVAVVPEPESVLATLAAGATLLAVRFYTRKVKYT